GAERWRARLQPDPAVQGIGRWLVGVPREPRLISSRHHRPHQEPITQGQDQVMDNQDTHRDTPASAGAAPADVMRTLGAAQGSPWRARLKWLAVLVAVLVVAYLLF